MARETNKAKIERATELCKRLKKLYPEKVTMLAHKDPFTLLISVMLSAQTTDAAVNKVTPKLFSRWPNAHAMANANPEDVGEVIRSIGFWRNKAKNAVEASKILVAEYDGNVPQTMEELTQLPGVGRKTANIVLNDAFGIVEGIAVDTHVFRIAKRMRLTAKKTPEQAEPDLLKFIPQQYWTSFNWHGVLFGREWCDSRNPRCPECPMNDICPYFLKGNYKP